MGAILGQQTPGSLVCVTLQFGVEDSDRGTTNSQLLSRLQLVLQVSQPALRVNLELFLPKNNQRDKSSIRLSENATHSNTTR
jgi:hypothetical protein